MGESERCLKGRFIYIYTRDAKNTNIELSVELFGPVSGNIMGMGS